MSDDIIGYTADFVMGGGIGLLSWFFGGRDGFLMVLLAFMVVDQLSGLAAGWVKHELSSDTGFKGLLKKAVILGFVGMAHLMDKYILAHTMLGETEAVRSAVCIFYIANEGISIIENADTLNIPIPDYLRKHFLHLREAKKKEKKSS